MGWPIISENFHFLGHTSDQSSLSVSHYPTNRAWSVSSLYLSWLGGTVAHKTRTTLPPWWDLKSQPLDWQSNMLTTNYTH